MTITKPVSIYKPTEAEVRRANSACDEFRKLASEELAAQEASGRRLMRMGLLGAQVRDRRWWMVRRSRSTGKPFRSFNEWLKEDGLGYSRAGIYRAMLSAEHLKELPPATVEELGTEKCVQLARVARDRPEAFKKVLKTLERSPELTVANVEELVSTTIAGRNGAKGERWTRMEFLLREADAQTVRQALLVAQAIEPQTEPESEYALGRHLKSICEEYLSGEDARKIWRRLDKAGAFSGAAFKLED